MSAEALLSRLEGVRATAPLRWIARCPAHDDKRPSLAIRELEDGRVLVHDFAGCGATDVLAAVGLEFDALFPPKSVDHENPSKAIRRPVFREDVFERIRFEATVVWLIGCDLAKGKVISKGDYARLQEAVGELERIKDTAYGR